MTTVEMGPKCPPRYDIPQVRLDHTSRLFYNLRILKEPDIVELRIGIIMFKAYHKLLPTYVQQFFSQHESVYASQQNLLKSLHVLI